MRRPSDHEHLRLVQGVGRAPSLLLTPDEPIALRKIGRGTFSTVYREIEAPERVFAFETNLTSDKEIAAIAHEVLPDNPHIPAVEYFGRTRRERIYTMPFYRAPLREENSKGGWRDYRTLKSIWGRAWHHYDDLELNQKVVERAAEAKVTAAVVEALDALVTTARYFRDDYALELWPRNLATDHHRRLVLLDVLWDRRAAEKRWRAMDRGS